MDVFVLSYSFCVEVMLNIDWFNSEDLQLFVQKGLSRTYMSNELRFYLTFCKI